MSYPRIYNAATDMVDRNVTHGRGAKPAFIDPGETLTYGELQARCNRMANLLATYGIARESRIALLLLDTVDFPAAFWGAIKAGVVPVCLNTLLTPEQYAYILGDSRAKALIVSAQLLPVVQPILGQLPFLKHIFVAGGEAPAFALPFRGELGHPVGRARRRRHLQRRDRVLALLVGLDRHAQGRAARALEPDGDGAADGPGLPRHARGRSRLLGRQAVLRLRARQRHVVSDVGRRDCRAAARAADAGGGVPHAQEVSADAVLRRADALCGHARLSAGHAGEFIRAPAPVRVGRRGAARRGRQGVQGALRHRRARRRRLHRDAAPVRLQQPRRREVRHVGQAGAGLRGAPRRRAGPRRPGRRGRRAAGEGTERRGGLLEPAREEPRHLRGRLDALGRQVHARRRGLLHLPGTHRRHVQGVGHMGVPVRGGERADWPPRGAGGRRGAQGGRRRAPQAPGLHRAQARQGAPAMASRRSSRSTSRPRPGCGSIPAGSRSWRDCRRRPRARSSASSCARAEAAVAGAVALAFRRRRPKPTSDRRTTASDRPPARALPAGRARGARCWCPPPAPRTCRTRSAATAPRGRSRNRC